MADKFHTSGNWWDSSRTSSSSTISSIDTNTSFDPNLHMIGLSLPSQVTDWNHNLKPEGGFSSMLREDLNSTNGNFQMDSAVFGSPSSSSLLQGLLGSDHQHLQQQPYNFENPTMNYPNYGSNNNNNNPSELVPSCWSKVAQLQFSNNAPFWNASSAATDNKVPSSFSPEATNKTQISGPSFDDKPKLTKQEIGDSGGASLLKKSGSEAGTKRPRDESASSTLPAFKAKKEKMGDRISALQQLVSPFGKTDTASVLSEAIQYIKFLHEQVDVLSTPYMNSEAPTQNHQNHQNSDKCNESEESKQDLISRGLCLIPVSSTFPVTHETIDFWTPTFGGTFR